MGDSVPDTDTLEVAALAVAWEIVRSAYNLANSIGGGDARAREIANAVIKVQKAIAEGDEIEK